MSPDLREETTDDAALGGRLRLLQPRRGHRFGHDAVLLAAAVPAQPGWHVVDLGAGVGAAGLAVAARVRGIRLTLVEFDPVLAALAARNIGRNDLGAIAVAVELDVTAPADLARAGLAAGIADCVAMNPPFHDPLRAQPSPDARRRAAHAGGMNMLESWTGTAARLLRPGGSLTTIYRADCADDVVAVLAGHGFGSVRVLPVLPKPGAQAIRVVVGGRKGEPPSTRHLPPLCLNDSSGRPSQEAENILRHAAALHLGA